MQRILGIFASGCLLAAGGAVIAGENTISLAEDKAGWKLLFDGKSASAFRNFKKDTLSPQWKVTNGELVRSEKGAGDIITKDQFGNFELLLEFKVAKGGNSGLMFKVTEDAAQPWHTGPEVQIQDNVDGHDPQKAGWLYQLYSTGNNPFTQKPLDTTRQAGTSLGCWCAKTALNCLSMEAIIGPARLATRTGTSALPRASSPSLKALPKPPRATSAYKTMATR